MPYATKGWDHADKLDWDATKVGGADAAPPGLYDAKVVSVTPKLSKTNKPMCEAKLELTNADTKEQREEGVGKMVFDTLMFSAEDKERFRTKNIAMVAGVDLPRTNSHDDVEAFAKELVGAKMSVMIKQESYEGTMRAKVAYYGDKPPKDEESNGKGRAAGGGGRRR